MADAARLLSVNTGRLRALDVKSGLTGHFKWPRNGAVRIGPLGLADDAIVDTDNHGGSIRPSPSMTGEIWSGGRTGWAGNSGLVS